MIEVCLNLKQLKKSVVLAVVVSCIALIGCYSENASPQKGQTGNSKQVSPTGPRQDEQLNASNEKQPDSSKEQQTVLAQPNPSKNDPSKNDPSKNDPSKNVQKAVSKASSVPWPLFRGDTQSTGVAQSELPEKLEVLWEFTVKKGAFEGSAVIVPDPERPDKQIVYVGDLDGLLYALDLESGEKIWEFKSEAGFGTSPAVKDGRIYIGDMDGIFYCLNSKGEKLWSFSAQGEINSSANFFEDQVLFGSQDAFLYSLNHETGELKWKYESQDQIRCSITVAQDRAFVAGCDGFFHVVNLKDGTGVGKVEIHSPTGSTPASVGSMVYFGNQSGIFFAIDSQKMETVWVYDKITDGDSIVGAAAVNDQHIVFGNRNRNVYSLDPKTGNENWKTPLKAKVDSSPVIVGDRAYVASTDGRLYALSLSDGKILWQDQFQGGFISSPAVAFGRLVIATNRGSVYCLGQKKSNSK